MSNAICFSDDATFEPLDDTALSSVVGGAVDCGDGDDGAAYGDGQSLPFNPYRDPPFPRPVVAFVGDVPRT